MERGVPPSEGVTPHKGITGGALGKSETLTSPKIWIFRISHKFTIILQNGPRGKFIQVDMILNYIFPLGL